MPSYIFDFFEYAPRLKHYPYREQHEFDKALTLNLAYELNKGASNTRDGRPNSPTLNSLSALVCAFRYQVKQLSHDNPYQVWLRYPRNNNQINALNTGYTRRVWGIIWALDNHGYLAHRRKGRNAPRESRFQFEPSFSNILEKLRSKDVEDPLDDDPTYSGVEWQPEHEIFVKKWERPRYVGGQRVPSSHRKQRIRLRNNEYQQNIAKDLNKHNDFISHADIQIDTNSLDTPEKKRQYKEFEARYPSPLRTTRLFRLFINEELTQYGRFHGAWWQFLTSALRPHLLINGERTVELDYGGLQPNILFSLNRVDVGDNFDPYIIENRSRKTGEDERHDRALVKKCFMYIANGKSPERYLTSVKSNLTRAINDTPKEEQTSEGFLKKKRLRELLDKRGYGDRFKADLQHTWSAIWDSFQVEAYLWRTLTIKETEITNNVHNRLRALNIPVLSIHDSYIVTASHHETLKQIMVEEFQNVLSVDRLPLIRQEGDSDNLEDDLEVIDDDDYSSNLYD